MKIILTGASGFIGKNIIENFSEFEIVPFSLRTKQISDIDFSNIDIVIHLAALVHQMKGAPEADYFKINSELTFNIASIAKNNGVKHFIFLSTVKVYGETTKEGFPWNEYSECKPTDPYGKSKLEAENRISALSDNNFQVSIIRTPLVYGKGVKGNVFSLMKLVEKINLLPLGGIENKRTMVYVKNLIALINRIIEKKQSGIFLAGDDTSMSTSKMVTIISSAMSKKIILFKIPKFILKLLVLITPNILERLYGSLELDCSFTNKKLNYKPPFSSEQGIKEMVQWYLKFKNKK